MKERSTPIESFTHIIDHRFTNNLIQYDFSLDLRYANDI